LIKSKTVILYTKVINEVIKYCTGKIKTNKA